MIKKLKIEKYHYVALVGWVAKIITVIFSLINTRMLLDLIGVNGFALYSIIFSLVGWLSLLNFAIPSAIQNTISKLRVTNQSLQKLFQTTLFVIILIMILGFPLVLLISNIVYNTLLSNYHTLIDKNYLFLMLFFLFLFGLSEIFNKILFALHKGYLPNIYPAAISVLSFIILYLLQYKAVHNINIVLILFFMPYAVMFVVSYIQSIGFIKPSFHKNIFKIVFKLMTKFFIFALLAAFVLKVDYIIMSLVLKAHEIAIYNIDMRVFNLILFMYGTILAALWPVTSELFHKKDYKAIKLNMIKNILLGILIATIMGFLIIYFKEKIFLLISGKESLTISLTTGLLTLFYIITRIWTDSFATILQSMNEVNILIFVVPFQAFISISSQYILGLHYGLNGIIMGLILSFLLTVVWVLPLKFYRLTKDRG